MLKKILLMLTLYLAMFKVNGQVTTLAPGNYKNIIIQSYSAIGNHTKALILIHEAYAETLLNANYAIGTITALRGSTDAWNRINVAVINSSASYNTTSGSVSSNYNNATSWKLKTCLFNGKKYLAVEVPYDNSYFTGGYKFTGWTVSTGENMFAVAYEVNGAPVNQSVISDIQDFIPNQIETHDVKTFNILGNVGIGTVTPDAKLAVAGNIHTREVKVSVNAGADFVFDDTYKPLTLNETEQFVKINKHLPGIAPEGEMLKDGINLSEMNIKLLQKIEELTLHLIEQNKEIKELRTEVNEMKSNKK